MLGSLPRTHWFAILLLPLILGGGALTIRTAYRYGKATGRTEERLRALRKSEAIPVSTLTPATPTKNVDEGPDLKAGLPTTIAQHRFWCFSALEATRLTWPMEILKASPTHPEPHIRNRQGSNRFASRRAGRVEFSFRCDEPAVITAYLRMRHSDTCGNSVRLGINDSPLIMSGDSQIFGKWIWERTFHRFKVEAGLHRVIIGSLEDGVE
ncbi:MAG: hypothetical protein ACYTGH_12490, partial [Planctomycetota bacterium]